MRIIEEFIFCVEFPEIEGEIFQDDVELVVIVDVCWWEDIIDLYYLGVLDFSKDAEFPERTQGKYAVGEYFAVLFDGIDLACFSMPHLIDLAIGSLAEDFLVDEAVVVDERLLLLHGLHF